MKRILIVEDDQKLNNGIRIALKNEYLCVQAFSVESALNEVKGQQFDLILLDINLPDGNGLDLLAEIRKTSRLPILLITANNMETDIVMGLESGANDYITKPFSLMVLRARVGVQLRDGKDEDGIYQSDNFYFNFKKMEFLSGREVIELSKTEQRLLCCLIENKGKSVSRSQLIDEIWAGETEFVDEHALTVVVNRLRNKLGDTPNHPEYIKTVYGIGYKWEKG